MLTLNPRSKIAQWLTQLAHHEHKSVSSLAKELILEALEHREDMALSALAESRERKGTERRTHEDTWKCTL